MSIKVSVIIPVYNAEQYLAPCIESLVNQTLTECEFIFINDGSIDSSRDIIEKYKKKDNRIKLFEQINQGVSMARNAGLKIASGEYIGFVDADDIIEKNMFEVLYKNANLHDCDIVISNFEGRMEGHIVVGHIPFQKDATLKGDFIHEKILPYFLKEDQLNSVCTKLYRSELIKGHKVKFPQNIALGEDGMFNMECFSHAEKIRFLDYVGYYYREVAGSATRNKLKFDYFKRAIEVFHFELPQNLFDYLGESRIKQVKAVKLINSVMAYLYLYFEPSKELAFRQRFKYINYMVHHEIISEALPLYMDEKSGTLGRYERTLLMMLKRKSVLGIYAVTAYSRLRNRFGGYHI
ncbi:MAG: glycosyltransferase [Bacillota bacterium]|nr:glycosyltransferase [Bacillota bacterium]